MAREALEAIPRAYRRDQAFSAYEEADLGRYPEDHVRRRKHPSRQFVVPNDILSRSGGWYRSIRTTPCAAHRANAR